MGNNASIDGEVVRHYGSNKSGSYDAGVTNAYENSIGSSDEIQRVQELDGHNANKRY
jgi:hypothetical protein